MSRTKPLEPEDLRFVEEFKFELQNKYREFPGTDEEFARKLNVSRPALLKYLNGQSMPGIRTIFLAYKNLDIHVRYGDFDTKRIMRMAKKNVQSPEAQILLPFAIESLTQENVQIEIGEKKKNGIALSVKIKFAS